MNKTTEAWEIAEQAWKNSRKKQGVAKRKCENCFRKWSDNGEKAEEKPPFFPSDYEGKCPACGNELSHSSIPF